MGFDVEAFLREHVLAAAIGVAAVLGCLAVLVRAHERTLALARARTTVLRVRALLEGKRPRPALLSRLDAIESRLSRVR